MEQPSAPAPSENSLIEQRREKLAKLRAKGIDPFKNKFTPDRACNEARSGFESGALPEGTKVSVAGRITAHREMGKSMFIDVRDQSGRIQIYAQKNVLGDEQWNVFTHLDLGDFIGVTGTLFRTKTGEPSIKLESFTILAKALRPPPAKWHGLEDTEIRYRQRYLDLMGNPDVKKVFLKRSAIVHEIRSFFHGRGYVEVETPAMQAIPGGAAAQPFKTFHNALGCEFYLRIALELYHKRLLVGGIDRLFEIGKNFRNEGLSRRHNPEFTMLEAYCAFGDYESMMKTVEELITTVAKKVNGSLIVNLATDKAEVEDAISKTMGAIAALGEKFPSHREVCDSFMLKLNDVFRSRLRFGVRSSAKAGFGLVAEYKSSIRNTELASATHLTEMLSEQATRLENLFEVKEIDLRQPWKRARYKDLIKEKAGADWFDITPAERRLRAIGIGADIGYKGPSIPLELLNALKDAWTTLTETEKKVLFLRFGLDPENIKTDYEDFEVTGAVFEKLIEPTLIQPTFVTHLPKELVPLAKLSPDDPTTVEVFECCINGQEIAPGYTEQNDPIQQRQTLEHQAGGEQQKLDEDFLVALEHGMPPAGGIGIGIDRLCMMLLGQESIRDVILFPQLKPK
jgi:lysyl-tRNA synthetase class II